MSLHDTWFDKTNEKVVFITELLDGGNLKCFLREKGVQRKNTIKKWCKQILSGIQFLHEQNISHRDIKSENVYINKNGNIKIGD